MSFVPSPCIPAGVRSVQEQRERWDRKRKRTGRELVQTEQKYCEQLDLIITVSFNWSHTSRSCVSGIYSVFFLRAVL